MKSFLSHSFFSLSVYFFSVLMIWSLMTWGAFPVLSEEPENAPTTISLWEQEQDRLRRQIQELEKKLEAAEALLHKRAANRELYKKQSKKSAQRTLSEKVVNSVNEKPQDETLNQYLQFDAPPTWKQFFDRISEQFDVEVRAARYPPGTVALQDINSINDETISEWLVEELRKDELEIWFLDDRLRITTQPPRQHPLLGLWETTQIIEGGKPSDEHIMLLFTRRFGIFWNQGESETFYYTPIPTVLGLNPEMDLFYPDEQTFLKASFKIDKNHAEILWGEVSADGLSTGEMVFMKLKRIE